MIHGSWAIMDPDAVEAACDGTAEGPLSPRGQRKLDQIIEGAGEVFAGQGFGGASVDEIARRAGISKATMYRYFPDKAAIFKAYVEREFKRQSAQICAIDFEHSALEDVLRQVGREFIRFMLTPSARSIYRIAVAESERFPEIGLAFFQSGPDEARRRLAPKLAAAMESGELARGDPDMASFQFFELCKARLFYRSLFCRECMPSGAAVEEQVEAAVRTFLKAYAPG